MPPADHPQMTLIEGGTGRHMTSFEPSILLGRDPLAVTRAVEEVALSLAGRVAGQSRIITRVGLLACEMHGAQASFLPVEKERALDWAAELLAIADALRSEGASMEALALEGVQGRLLEALTGAGPMLVSSPPEGQRTSRGAGTTAPAPDMPGAADRPGPPQTPPQVTARRPPQHRSRRRRCRYGRDDTEKGR